MPLRAGRRAFAFRPAASRPSFLLALAGDPFANFNYNLYTSTRLPLFALQCLDLAPAGRAGRPAHAAQGRQRGGRRDRGRRGHDHRRTGRQATALTRRTAGSYASSGRARRTGRRTTSALAYGADAATPQARQFVAMPGAARAATPCRPGGRPMAGRGTLLPTVVQQWATARPGGNRPNSRLFCPGTAAPRRRHCCSGRDEACAVAEGAA